MQVSTEGTDDKVVAGGVLMTAVVRPASTYWLASSPRTWQAGDSHSNQGPRACWLGQAKARSGRLAQL